jgi:hypothetical protein
VEPHDAEHLLKRLETIRRLVQLHTCLLSLLLVGLLWILLRVP